MYEFLPQRRKGRKDSILNSLFFASLQQMYIVLLLRALLEDFHRRQLLAFEEFQERATGR